MKRIWPNKKISFTLLMLFGLLFIAPIVLPDAPTAVQAQAKTVVRLNKTSAVMRPGKTVTLKVQGTSKKVSWSSSNKKVATVSSKGKVTAKKYGAATITAKVRSKKYNCKVKVLVSDKNADYMEKYLKYCKEGKYKLANKYNSKLPKAASSEACVKNMPSNMRRAYENVAQQYHMPGVYFTDINKDHVPDMLIPALGGEIAVFTYKQGKVVKCGRVYVGYNYPTISAYPEHNGVVVQFANLSYQLESVQIITLTNNKASIKTIKTRETKNPKIHAPRYELKEQYLDVD